MTDRLVFPFEDGGFREVKPGMRRRIFNGDNLSLCFWRIEQHAGPTPYDGHPHNEQFGMIIRGELDFRLGSDERRLLKPGDVYYAPTGMPHGDSHFIPDPQTGDTWILDIFSPVREDYRDG